MSSRRAAPPPVTPGAPGALPTVTLNGPPTSRYRLQIGVNAQNLTNRANYVNYSGVLLSPFFGQPTAVSNPRKVDMSISLAF